MAEGGGTGVDDHVNVRTCSICMEYFKDPKLLPCFHTFCLGCLHRLTSGVMAGKQFPCPVCRYPVTLPGSGPPGFQTNFYIEAAKTRREFHGTVCEICSKPATCRCKECVQSLCEDCSKVHSSLTSTKSHYLIRLQNTSKHRPAMVSPEFCTKHIDERLRFHCKKCEKPICRDCKMTSHEGHSTVDLEDAVNEGRKTLAKLKHCFVKLETMFQKKDTNLKYQMKTFSNSVEEIKNDIDRETDTVKHPRASQKMAIEKCYLAEMKCLKTTEETINKEMMFVKSQTDYISTLLTGGCGADIMKAVTDMSERLDQSNGEHDKLDDYHGLILCRQQMYWDLNSTALRCMPEPVELEVVSEFQCFADGSAPDVISPEERYGAWIAVKGRPGNGYVRLFNESGKKINEGGVWHFRPDTKLKHEPKTDTMNGMTCTVDVLNHCVTVVNKSGRIRLKLSCGVDFAPVDVCWGPDDTLVIVDRASNSVLMYKQGDENISSFVCGRRDEFRPCAIAWDGSSRLWIGDLSGRVFVVRLRDNNRLRGFDQESKHEPAGKVRGFDQESKHEPAGKVRGPKGQRTFSMGDCVLS